MLRECPTVGGRILGSSELMFSTELQGSARVRHASAFNLGSSLWAAAFFILFSSAQFQGLLAQDGSPAAEPAPKPAARIDLAPMGYREPSRSDRLTEDSPSVSLDFVDADHVLLSFNRKKLFHRLPSCPPDHEDRLMHAAVLELPTGKILTETDWYLHDRRRYLWPMGPGKFLLRRGRDLYTVDSRLHEKLLMSSPKDLLWVAVTPDASQIVVETANEASPAAAQPQIAPSPAKQAPRYAAQFLDATTLAPRRTLPLNKLVNLAGTSRGYADLVQKGDVWLVRFGSTPTRRRNLARVRSQTVPNVVYSSDDFLLVGRCPTQNCDYSVTAFTVTGHRLWQQHWPRYRFFPATAASQDGSRFGISTLRLSSDPAATQAAISPASSVGGDEDIRPEISELDVFQQEIKILDTASGNSVFSVNVSPAIQSGQNFSLSPDGHRVAVLQGLGLEVFDLPRTSDAELTKFSALKADFPAVYSVEATSDSTPETEEVPVAESAEPTTPADIPAAEKDATNAAPPENAARTPSPPAGQTTQTANSPIPTVRVSTTAVVVDVVVTDSKGHPTKGLHQQDFQLTEDGKSQDLRAFREFTGGQEQDASTVVQTTSATQAKPAAPPAKLSPNVFTNHGHAPEPGAVTMVLFDLLNTPSQDQVYARQQLMKFLMTKPKTSQLALCTLSEGASRLRLLQGFTPDETLLLAAAKGKKAGPKEAKWQVSAAGTENAANNVGVLAQEGQTSGFQGLLSALQGMQAEQQVTDTTARSAITLDSMMLLARYLSGIPGRKNLVWLSGSFPISLTATTNSGDLSLDNPNYSYKIRRVTNLLAEAQVAVYPVDVRGLLGAGLEAGTAGGMGGPTSIDPQDFSSASVISPSPAVSQDMQSLAQQAAERDTLTQFATATGGKAFYNTNGIREAIATADEQGSNYYTLSYNPTNKAYDGKFRRIKVQLAEKGYTLHYRQGYFASDARAAAEAADLGRRTRAVAMQHGSPPSRQLLFSARVVPVGAKKKVDRAKLADILVPPKTPLPSPLVEVQHYSIDYTFAGSELRFVPLENANYRNVVTLMATSFDSEGRMLTGMSNVGTSDLQPDAYKKMIAGEFGVHQDVDVPVEAASLRLGIQDQMSSHLGTVEIPLPVPPAPDTPRHVRNPLPEIEPD